MSSTSTPRAASGEPPAIELDRISKSFDGGSTFAVRELSLAIRRSSFVALVGGSGTGKTTTLKTINRLIEPDSGDVRVNGEPVLSLPPHELRRRIGYVFQSLGLFPHLTVGENIGITPSLLGWQPEQTRARVEELMDLMGLPREYTLRRPAALSGGQRQRVAVARALAARSSIMLMDEPFGALDPLTREALGAQYRELHERMRLTTLMVTHDVLEAVLLADRIVVMRAGEIVADGTPRQLMDYREDEGVRALMDMPRRQAQRVQELLSHGEATRE